VAWKEQKTREFVLHQFAGITLNAKISLIRTVGMGVNTATELHCVQELLQKK